MLNRNRYIVSAIFFLGVMIQPLKGDAQLAIRNIPLYAARGAYIYVSGDVDYWGNKLIDLYGTMEITGDWYNNSLTDNIVFDKNDDGTVLMSGEMQAFNGGLPTRFPNLKLAGSDKKFLNTNIEIRRQLDLTDKELDVNSNRLYILSNDEHAINFLSGEGYINTSGSTSGWLVRNMAPGNSYIFPLGAEDTYNNIRYRPIVLSAEHDGNICAQFQNYAPGRDGFPSNHFNVGLKKVDSNYYHAVETDSGDINTVSITELPFNAAQEGTYNTVALWDMTNKRWYATNSSGPGPTIYPTNDYQFSANNIDLEPLQRLVIDIGNTGKTNDTLKIHLPNIITPNGDGINDDLVFTGLNQYPENELIVFNRWNNNVYEQHNYQNNWNGSNLDEGTYFYLLRVKDDKGEWHVAKNYLIIKR